MSVMMLARSPLPFFPVFRSKLWWVCLVFAIFFIFVFVSTYAYASGFGGWVSEKLVNRDGLADSNLLIGISAVPNSGLELAMTGRATPLEATNIYMDGVGTHATLNGNLLTLNGFPSVYVYFQWGYDGVNYVGITAPQLMVATGSFSANIAGFHPGKRVYYRTVVDADGLTFSSPSSFVSSGGIVSGFNLLNAVVVVAYIAMVLFIVIAVGSRSTIMALLVVAVAIYLGEAFVVAIQESLNRVFGG